MQTPSFSTSMTDEEIADFLAKSHAALVATFMDALQLGGALPAPTGRPVGETCHVERPVGERCEVVRMECEVVERCEVVRREVAMFEVVRMECEVVRLEVEPSGG